MVQQITWQNVNAPDLSRASEIMGRAAAGFQTGTAGIAENLQGIRDRQRTNRSAAAFPMLAGINSGGNVDDILGRVNAAVRPEDMTPELRDAMMAARGLGMGYDQTGASTRSVNDATGRANTEFDRIVAREDQAAAYAGEITGLHEAARNSQTGPYNPNLSQSFRDNIPGIFAGESGGDYNKLYGNAEQSGGPFAGVKVTEMTVDQALDFANPSGAYGQYVARNNGGTVSTPMGGFQVIGSTLADAKRGMGLTGNEIMTPALQDQIGQWIYDSQGTGAWEGFRPGTPPVSGLADIASRPGNLQSPEFYNNISDDLYAEGRQARQDSQNDAAFALEEAARVKAETEARRIESDNAEAARRLEAMKANLGAGDTGRTMFDMIQGMTDISPGVRAAMQAGAAGTMAEISPGFMPPSPLPETEADRIMAANASQMAVDATLSANGPMGALIAAGVVPNPNAAASLAPDGTVLPTDLVAQKSSVAEQLGKLTGGDSVAVDTSAANIMEIVDSVYKTYDRQIDKSVIMAMVSQNLASTDNWFSADTLTIDEKALTQSLAPIATEPMQKAYIEANRQEYLAAAAIEQDMARNAEAKNNLWYWQQHPDAPGSSERQADAQKVMDETFARVTAAGDKAAAKSIADEQLRVTGKTPEELAQDTAAAKQAVVDAELASQTSKGRKEAIVAGGEVPTSSGVVVDPASSAFWQHTAKVDRERDISMDMADIKGQLQNMGGDAVSGFIGSALDNFRGAPEVAKNEASRARASAAYDWFTSKTARAMFDANPSLLPRAKEDPLAFFEETVLGKRPAEGPRSIGQQPMSNTQTTADTILRQNANPPAQAPAAVVPAVPRNGMLENPSIPRYTR